MEGKLDLSNIFSMPIQSPHFLKPPFMYRNSRILLILATVKGGSIEELVPSNLKLLGLGGEYAILIYHAYYPFCDKSGPYNEVIVAPLVLFNEKPYLYVNFIYVDNDVALTAGREIWGFPKKFAFMEIKTEGETIEAVLERPKGKKLLSTMLRIEKQASIEDIKIPGLPFPIPILTMKVIPPAEEEGKPTVQLIETEVKLTPRLAADGSQELWVGNAIVDLPEKSISDPLYKIGEVNPVISTFGYFDLVLPFGKTIKHG